MDIKLAVLVKWILVGLLFHFSLYFTSFVDFKGPGAMSHIKNIKEFYFNLKTVYETIRNEIELRTNCVRNRCWEQMFDYSILSILGEILDIFKQKQLNGEEQKQQIFSFKLLIQ